jgi:hypothetical protein
MAPLRVGPARYVASVSLHGANEPWDVNTAERFHLLSRSFALEVLPAGYSGGELAPLVHHPVAWARVS